MRIVTELVQTLVTKVLDFHERGIVHGGMSVPYLYYISHVATCN